MSSFDPEDTFPPSANSSAARHASTALISSLDAYRSKLSLQSFSYPLLDPYLPLFTSSTSRTGLTDSRSSNPLIRRGYYSRLKCIDISLKRFLDEGDITSEELPEKLLEFLDSDKRTLVVLEAVAMYLPSEELKFILERLNTSFNKLEIVIYDTVLRGRFGQIMKQNLIRAGVNPLGLTKTSLQDWTTFLEGIGFKDLKMEMVNNPLVEHGDDGKEIKFETAEVGRGYEETVFVSPEIIKGDPNAQSWESHLKVDHNAKLNCLAVSPDEDERYVVAGGNEFGHVYFIDKRKGSEVQKVKLADDDLADDDPFGVECLAFQPKTCEEDTEEETIVYASTYEGHKKPGKIYAVNLSTSEITNTLEGHTKSVNDLAVSPNGETLISISLKKGVYGQAEAGEVRIWDISKEGGGKEVKVIEEDEHINSVTISHDSSYFCTGGGIRNTTKGIHVYDMTNDDYKLLTKLEGHSANIISLTSSPDSKKLFSGSRDNTIKIWDTSPPNAMEWTLLKTLAGHTKDVNRISLSPCSHYLASGSGYDHDDGDTSVKVWNVEAGVLLRTIKFPQMIGISGVSFGRNSTIYSASGDGRVRAWNLGAKVREHLRLEGHEHGVKGVAISGDGCTIVSASEDKSVRVWDAQTGKQKACLEGHTDFVKSVAISKDAKLAISGSRDNTVRIWSLEGEGKELKKIDFGKRVEAATFSSDEKSFFAGGGDALLKQFSVDNYELIKEFEGHTHGIYTLETTSDGKHLFSGSQDNTIIVWDVESGEKIRTLEGHTSYVQSVNVTPDNSKIVSASLDKTAKLWELETGKHLHTFEGHSDSVVSVSVHPSGDFIATGSKDKTWELWSLHPPYNLLYTSRDSHTSFINSVAFSPDGNSLISGSKDKTVNIADVVSQLNYLPSLIHDHIFKDDCNLDDIAPTTSIDWSNTKTISLLQRNPNSLNEPRFDLNSQQTLTHLAAKNGRSDFLAAALIVPNDDTEDEVIKNNTEDRQVVGYKYGWQSRQKVALSSVTLRDSQNKTPLALAVTAESGPVVKVLLYCYTLLLSQTYALPFNSKNTSQDQHPSSLFPLDELNLALSKFPQLALTFLSQLKLNTSGDHLVQDGVKRHEIGSSGRLIEGSKSRVPQHFWSAKLKKTDDKGLRATLFGLLATQEKGLPVTAKFVPIKDIAAPNSIFLRSVVVACSATKKYTVFENEVIQTLVEHKWSTYVEKMFFFHLYLDIAMVFFLTVDALTYKTAMASDTHIANKIVGHIPMLITLGLWTFFARHEYNQWASTHASTTFKKIRIYLDDFWNVLDVLSLSSIFVAYASRIVLGVYSFISAAEGVGFDSASFHWSTLAMAFALPLSYLNTLFYMQGHKESGELVRMIIGIIQGIRVFLAILIVCMVGFAASFFVLFEGQSNSDGDSTHAGPVKSFLLSYTVLLAGFVIDDLDGSASFFSTGMLFIGFTIFINIIMLNLLIAIMGDIFDKIQESAKAEFIFARANIILEFEGTLTKKQKENNEWFPTWLQVLVPTLENDGSEDGAWVGRVRALKKSINRLERQAAIAEKKRTEERKSDRRSNEKKAKKLEQTISEIKVKLKESEKQRTEENLELKEMLQILCGNFSADEKRERLLNEESNNLMEELGVTVDDLEPQPTDAKSKNEVLKELQRQRLLE
ncbi:hypothetical protein TrLO_g10470 [Triparma laevis f. longispina]|uniref:Ion transport domain-containing protein n=1 Tax=Triparma laevis f. longispina TaxID=1714387 RepID=A0A9W7KTT5_9STRA|nr:hypothetical protein TrLO_g10470 [Triparma laevis f. longispina]